MIDVHELHRGRRKGVTHEVITVLAKISLKHIKTRIIDHEEKLPSRRTHVPSVLKIFIKIFAPWSIDQDQALGKLGYGNGFGFGYLNFGVLLGMIGASDSCSFN